MNKNPLSNLLGAFCAVLLVAFALALTPSKAPASPAPELSNVTLTAVDHVPAAPLASPIAALPLAFNIAESPGTLLALIAAAGLAIALVFRRFSHRFGSQHLISAINTNPANYGLHHGGRVTMLADAAITTRFKLVKKGSDASHIAIPSATSDEPIGVCADEPGAAEDPVSVIMLGAHDGTVPMVAGGTITDGARLYMNSNGSVTVKPTSAGTYWFVGTARGAWSSGEVVEVIPSRPRKLIVIAALGNTNSEISGLTFSSTPTQAEANALRDKCEELADDVRAIATALDGDADVALATT